MSSFPGGIPKPAYASKKQLKPNVRRTQFGSGYVQRATFGINQNPAIYNFTFNCTTGQAILLDDYLAARAGVEKFTFLVPDEEQVRQFICPEWTRVATTNGVDRIDVVFVEVFDP